MSTTLSLVSEMERIANALGTEREDASQVSLSSVAEKIAKNLGVRNDEVPSSRFPRAGGTCTFWCRKP